MQFTAQDLVDFNKFVTGRLSNGDPQSIVELAREWEAKRGEFDETVAELRDRAADMEAGKGGLFTKSIAELRRKHNIPRNSK